MIPDRPKIQLDYSSPAEEKKREDQHEQDRREKIETYNEATFGAKHPIRVAFGWRIAIAAVGLLLALLLPDWWWWPIRLTLGAAATALVIWENVRYL